MDCKKNGELGQFTDLRGAWQERRGEVDSPMHTVIFSVNQWSGFYMIGTSVIKGLMSLYAPKTKTRAIN